MDNKEERYLFIATAEEQDDGTLNINLRKCSNQFKIPCIRLRTIQSEILYLIALLEEFTTICMNEEKIIIWEMQTKVVVL